ncbi:MAG: amino acid permease C-terminal domain-containing protein [Spirosomataceae bacterium]
MPYINGQVIVLFLWIGFTYFSWERISGAFSHFGNEQHQEYLFLAFIILSLGFAIYSFIHKWSLIPVLGVLFCSYLMIEIPINSWYVFFGWMALGLAIYLGYGYRKSRLSE